MCFMDVTIAHFNVYTINEIEFTYKLMSLMPHSVVRK